MYRKQAAQLQSELDATGLTAQDLAKMFSVSVRKIKGWTTGANRSPKWLVSALRLYGLLPPDLVR